MKYIALIATLLVATEAFSPAPVSRAGTSLQAKKGAAPAKKSVASAIFGLDLFAPVKDQNNYGARNKKNLKTGKITEKSYVPNGLTKAQYEKVRDQAVQKKAANYEKNVKKAGKFIDFTAWYISRGTDTKEGWSKDVTKGHTMAKTKYDWSGNADKKLWVTKK